MKRQWSDPPKAYIETFISFSGAFLRGISIRNPSVRRSVRLPVYKHCLVITSPPRPLGGFLSFVRMLPSMSSCESIENNPVRPLTWLPSTSLEFPCYRISKETTEQIWMKHVCYEDHPINNKKIFAISRTLYTMLLGNTIFSCICLFVLYVLVFVICFFLLLSGVGCGLWLWHSLDFSINLFSFIRPNKYLISLWNMFHHILLTIDSAMVWQSRSLALHWPRFAP